jgi:hypothetical protein
MELIRRVPLPIFSNQLPQKIQSRDGSSSKADTPDRPACSLPNSLLGTVQRGKHATGLFQQHLADNG